MSTTSPNMTLVIPTVGVTIGPEYASNVNADLSLIDSHDHTPGKGVQITPAGLNINADLPMNNHFLTSTAGVSFLAQAVVPGLSTIYQSGVDLYFTDGNGSNIRITQSGGVAGTPGSITNLIFPASVTYIPASRTFEFESEVGVAANLDAASILLRNINPNSTYALTLSPPAGLSTNYGLTLPTLPAQQSFMTLDQTGQMAAPWTVDNNTIKIVSNQLVAQASALAPNREHAWELNGNYSRLTYPLLNIDSIFIAPSNINITSVWIYVGKCSTPVVATTTEFDLKVANPLSAIWTSILSTTGKVTSSSAFPVADDTYTDSGSVIPPITGVVKPVISTGLITAGQAVKFDLIQAMQGSNVLDARIRIFYTTA